MQATVVDFAEPAGEVEELDNATWRTNEGRIADPYPDGDPVGSAQERERAPGPGHIAVEYRRKVIDLFEPCNSIEFLHYEVTGADPGKDSEPGWIVKVPFRWKRIRLPAPVA